MFIQCDRDDGRRVEVGQLSGLAVRSSRWLRIRPRIDQAKFTGLSAKPSITNSPHL